jgi:nitrite reductase/ring-hydroxylating ferredoxin subunit
MNRRKFVEQSCFACMATMAGISLLSLESCAGSKNVLSVNFENGSFLVPAESFQSQNYQVIKSPQYSDEVFVIKNADNTFKAFKMSCTHKGVALKVENNELNCSAHGSKFSFEGKVTNGPAKTNLQEFEVEVKGNIVKIKTS